MLLDLWPHLHRVTPPPPVVSTSGGGMPRTAVLDRPLPAGRDFERKTPLDEEEIAILIALGAL